MKPWFKYALHVGLVVLFYNLLDLIYETVITRNDYHFDMRSNLMIPLVAGAIGGALSILDSRKKS